MLFLLLIHVCRIRKLNLFVFSLSSVICRYHSQYLILWFEFVHSDWPRSAAAVWRAVWSMPAAAASDLGNSKRGCSWFPPLWWTTIFGLGWRQYLVCVCVCVDWLRVWLGCQSHFWVTWRSGFVCGWFGRPHWTISERRSQRLAGDTKRKATGSRCCVWTDQIILITGGGLFKVCSVDDNFDQLRDPANALLMSERGGRNGP
jgi:hypothetical protein